MLDINIIRNETERVKAAVARKKFAVDIDELLSVDEKRRQLAGQIDDLRAKRKTVSGSIRQLDGDAKAEAIEHGRVLREKISDLEETQRQNESHFDELMLMVPGLPVDGIPDGASDEDNLEIRRVGTIPEFDFDAKDHVELCESLGLADFSRAAKYAGGRAYLLTANGALLEYAVTRFAMDVLMARGWSPMVVPLLVNAKAMYGTGFFPHGLEDTYQLPNDELYLVGTSEVSLVSIHRDEVLAAEALPIRYAGMTTCFRREAGNYGRDTRGLYRVHQFQKVEQVSIIEASEEASESEHYRLLDNSETILKALGIPYRVALACTQELGMGQARKHEIESWMPSRKAYCETHSCSTMHDFQARRSRIRYRPEPQSKPLFTHTLNNTAIASPRFLIPLLELNQQSDGSVLVPEPLRPYMNGTEVLEPK